MACSHCGSSKPNHNCGKCGMSPAVVEIKNPDNYTLFRKVVIPSSLGDESVTPPEVGRYRNVLLEYQANGHVYLYSSDCVPTALGVSQGGILLVDAFPEVDKATQGALYVNVKTGEARATNDGEEWVVLAAGSGAREFDDLENRPKYNGIEMTSDTDIPDLSPLVNSLSSSLSAETAARAAGDNALQNELDYKVNKEAGKGLSSNDFTDTDKEKLDSLSDPKTLTIVQGETETEYDTTKDVRVEIADPDLDDYYTKAEVDSIAQAIDTGSYVVVETLPTEGDGKKIYLVKQQDGTYDRYIYTDSGWENIGNTSIDLTGYYTKDEADTLLASKADVSDVTDLGDKVDSLSDSVDEKQDKLIAGENITISGNTISAQIDTSDFVTQQDLDSSLAGKQDTLVVGDGIKIDGNVISLDPDTALTALGYEEIEIAKTDVNNQTVTIKVIGKIEGE